MLQPNGITRDVEVNHDEGVVRVTEHHHFAGGTITVSGITYPVEQSTVSRTETARLDGPKPPRHNG